MNAYSFNHAGKTYNRVSKAAAKKAYLKGLDIVIAACNIRPFNYAGVGYTQLSRKNREQFIIDETGAANDFTSYINSFEYYNCNNSETGKYAAFYVQEV